MPGARVSSVNPSLAGLLACGAGLGVLFSMRYLSQPFVWTNWPVAEVLAGWLEVLWGRLAVGLCMAVALWWALRGSRRAGASVWRAAAALSGGAAAGELALLAIDAPDAATDAIALLGRMLRWIAVILVLVGLYHLRELRRAEEQARQAAEARRQQTESQLLRMRLVALQAQIEPHFLFNTLATVQQLAGARRELGTRLLDHLITFVRLSGAVMPERVQWTVSQEMELVRAYLGVIQMRMDGRLQVAIHSQEDVAAVEFPPLLLATLVENAIKHGIGPAADGGAIEVQVTRDEASLHAEVRDTGVGFVSQSGSGIGLANSRARLRALYGPAASLRLVGNQPHGVVARLSLPLEPASCAP